MGLAAGLGALALPASAFATLARALTVEQLARGSARVVRALPEDSYSVWETVNDQRRIVTYTRAFVGEDLGESKNDGEVLIATLGGRVGKIAQLVHGEAALRAGEESVLFLSGAPSDGYRVTALAQGHFPLIERDGSPLLERSPQLPELVPTRDAAVERLHHRSFAEGRRMILEALGR